MSKERKLTMRILYIALILNACIFNNVSGQGKLKKTYAYNSIDQMGLDSMPFKLYFIIDSAKSIRYKNRLYYQLTISTDSSDYCGYVSLNEKKNRLDFVSKFYQAANYKSMTDRMRIGTPLFQFKKGRTAKLYYLSFLGPEIKIHSSVIDDDRQKEKLYRMLVEYFMPMGSHSICVYDLIFVKGEPYPRYITFADPFLGNIKCNAE